MRVNLKCVILRENCTVSIIEEENRACAANHQGDPVCHDSESRRRGHTQCIKNSDPGVLP